MRGRLFLYGLHSVMRGMAGVLIGLSSLSCGSGGAEWASVVRWPDQTLSTLPTSAAYPGQGAVIVLDEGRMEVYGGGQVGFSVFETHRIVKVFDQRGERFANIVIPYSEGSSIDEIEARTISPDGSIVVVEGDDIFDVSLYPNFVFFSDQRAKIFTMPAVEPGAVLEYRYRLTIRSRTFWHSWVFQQEVPTMRSRFTLVGPSEWQVNYRVYGITAEPTRVRTPEGFKSTYVWDVQDIPPVASEFAMPPRSRTVARLMLAPVGFASWSDVARWYSTLSEPRMKADARLEALAAELTGGARTDEEKLARIFTWVKDRVRYLAVEIGIGGFQPHPAEDVFLNLYGDCKDMTTILCTLGREAGIDMRQALISTWQNGGLDTTLASPLQFNHVIAFAPAIRAGGIWMDATEKGCPFGQLPWYDQGEVALVIGEDGMGELVGTPAVEPNANSELYHWKVQLKQDGSASVKGRTLMTGAVSAEVREDLRYQTTDARRQWIETLLAKECTGAKVEEFSLNGLGAETDTLSMEYSFQTPLFGARRDSDLVVQPGRIAMSVLPDYFRSVSRRHPVALRFGMAREVQIDISPPPGRKPAPGTMADTVTSKFGHAGFSLTKDGNVLRYRGFSVLKGGSVPPSEYTAFQSFLDAMRMRDLREIVLVSP